MCQMSHGTCHASHVTCLMSHVTCHMSPITYHLSPVTCHQANRHRPQTPLLTPPFYAVGIFRKKQKKKTEKIDRLHHEPMDLAAAQSVAKGQTRSILSEKIH